MPTININDDTVSLVSWLVSNGDSVFEGQPICEVETSKAIEEVLSPADGFIQILQSPGDVATGTVIGHLVENAGDNCASEQATPGGNGRNRDSVTDASIRPRFTRAARVMMLENDIGESSFQGKVLVRSADVVEYLSKTLGSNSSAALPRPSSMDSTSTGLSPSQRRAQFRGRSLGIPKVDSFIRPNEERPSASVAGAVPVTKRKREEIRALSEGHLNALPSVLTQVLDVSGLQEYLSILDDNVTITIASIVTFEVARALGIYKEFNAAYTDHGVIYHEHIHVGMAIDGAHGLKVAAIEHANQKSIIDISSEMELLLNQYNDNRLTATSLTSSTFNISDLTSLEIPWFVPLISRNQSAILGLGLSQVGGKQYLTLSLTFDHRVTEGKRAAEFLRELKARLTSYVLAANQNKFPSEEMMVTPTCWRCLRSVEEIPGDNKFLLQVMQATGQKAWMCKPCVEGW